MAHAVALMGVLGGAAGTTMTKRLGPAGAEGGLCMDGSPAGFYYAPAPSANSTLWVISFQGGGACYDKPSCDSRAKTKFGSSKSWTNTVTEGGLLADTAEDNPDFYDSYKVYIPYCSGDTHMGMRDKPDSTSWGYYFSGHLNVRNFIGMLLNDSSTGTPLKAATHILVTGGSAGGVGAFGNVDYIASQFPWATVKGVPICGFFFPGHTDDQADPALPPSDWAHWSKNETGSLFESDYVASLWQPYTNADCAKSFPSNMTWACGSVGAAYPFIKSPIFLLENQYDTNQLYTQLKAPKTEAGSNPLVQGFIAYFGRAMRATITKEYLKEGDGAFLPSCLDHGTGLGIGTTATTIPNAPTQRALVGDWYWERKQIKEYFVPDTCSRADGLPCNPTCDGVKPSDDNCQKELESLDCLGKSTSACEDCARAHRSELEKAGCTVKEVGQLCTA